MADVPDADRAAGGTSRSPRPLRLVEHPKVCLEKPLDAAIGCSVQGESLSVEAMGHSVAGVVTFACGPAVLDACAARPAASAAAESPRSAGSLAARQREPEESTCKDDLGTLSDEVKSAVWLRHSSTTSDADDSSTTSDAEAEASVAVSRDHQAPMEAPAETAEPRPPTRAELEHSLGTVKASQEVTEQHNNGTCKPCSYFWHKADGCRNEGKCEFCHLCSKVEGKRRRNERIKAYKASEAESTAKSQGSAAAGRAGSSDEQPWAQDRLDNATLSLQESLLLMNDEAIREVLERIRSDEDASVGAGDDEASRAACPGRLLERLSDETGLFELQAEKRVIANALKKVKPQAAQGSAARLQEEGVEEALRRAIVDSQAFAEQVVKAARSATTQAAQGRGAVEDSVARSVARSGDAYIENFTKGLIQEVAWPVVLKGSQSVLAAANVNVDKLRAGRPTPEVPGCSRDGRAAQIDALRRAVLGATHGALDAGAADVLDGRELCARFERLAGVGVDPRAPTQPGVASSARAEVAPGRLSQGSATQALTGASRWLSADQAAPASSPAPEALQVPKSKDAVLEEVKAGRLRRALLMAVKWDDAYPRADSDDTETMVEMVVGKFMELRCISTIWMLWDDRDVNEAFVGCLGLSVADHLLASVSRPVITLQQMLHNLNLVFGITSQLLQKESDQHTIQFLRDKGEVMEGTLRRFASGPHPPCLAHARSDDKTRITDLARLSLGIVTNLRLRAGGC